METDVQLLQTWYDTWLVVAGFAAALVLAVLAAARSGWKTTDLLLKVVMVLSVLATVPLTMVRLGMNRTFEDDTTAGFLSVAGTAVAIVVGLTYLIAGRSRTEEAAAVVSEEVATPIQGVPLIPEDESATRTLDGGVTPAPDLGATLVGDAGPVAAQAPAAWLMFKSGPRAGQSIPLSTEATKIGRGSENDVVVDDPAVSREHATISFENGHYVVEDAGSSGGTIVEGTAAGGQTILSSGSTLQLGETELVFMQSDSPAPMSGTGMGTGIGGGEPGRPGETLVMEQPSTVMAWLAVTAGSDKGKTFQLKEGDTTIGRGQDNDLVIADAAVSRRHAMVKHQNGSFIVVDMGSGGGTKVNNQTVGGKAVRTGSIITVGQTRMAIVDVQAQQADAPAASSEGATMVDMPAAGGGVLVVQSGPDAGVSFNLSQDEITIGRDPECQVQLTDPTVSRQHAVIRRHGDEYTVHDLGSSGGTQVDGESLTGVGLSAGDVIAIGRTEIVLMQPVQGS
ncbi:MAG: FHA domain-containing protein [Chloroflexi bacterium]|nr:FHA domain-containing protein [Chloroflexota bacterium]